MYIILYIGDISGDDKSALNILCKIFSKKNESDTLVYMYEEYEVKHNETIYICMLYLQYSTSTS